MSIPQVFNGVTYPIPVQGDTLWGPALTRYLVALGTYALAPSGGAFTLTADVNFGNNFGLVSKYLTSESNGTATAGMLRLAHNDIIAWRNAAGNGNLTLTTNGSDQLTFQGSALQPAGNYISDLTGDVTATGPGSVPATLATVNASPGTYVSANITVNAKGLITAASSGAGGGTVTSVSGTTNQINSTGGAAPVLSLSSTLVFPGTATGTLTGHSTLDLPLTGGTMSGAIAMGTSKITGLGNGSAAQDAAAFGQVPVITAGQIVGTATNNNATAGNVGEYVESVFSNVANGATGVYIDATSISLTAGDWEVTLNIALSQNTASTLSSWNVGISTTSGNSGTGLVLGSNAFIALPGFSGSTNQGGATVAGYRQSLSGTTTVYAKANIAFVGGTWGWYGRLSARRMR